MGASISDGDERRRQLRRKRETCDGAERGVGIEQAQKVEFLSAQAIVLRQECRDDGEEVIEVVERTGSVNPTRLADELGLSESGGIILVARLKKKGKL